MMRSVSMLSPGSGMPVPETRLIFSMGMRQLPVVHLADVDDFSRDGGRGNHCGAHEERAARRASLASLEVAVRRGRADLTALEAILVHRQAHRAARAAPVEARL